MKLSAYILVNAALFGATVASDLPTELKALTVAIIIVVGVISNLLYIGEKSRQAIMAVFTRDINEIKENAIRDFKEEIIRLDYIKHDSSRGKVSSIDKKKE
jgi:hypothetical protein